MFNINESNKKITLSGEELLEALKEINIILISLNKMGSFYGDKFQSNDSSVEMEYAFETTKFIDEWEVTQRLAKVREILSVKFDRSLGDDDMDDLERSIEDLNFWSKPGDKPDEN